MSLTKNDIGKINELNLDMNLLYKMSFIYNALDNGWSIKKLKNNKFEFTKKNTEEIKKEFYLDTFIDKFINSNLNINKIINGH